MPKTLITTAPFTDKNPQPLELLKKANIDYLINSLNKNLAEDELAEMVSDFGVIIAGTRSLNMVSDGRLF